MKPEPKTAKKPVSFARGKKVLAVGAHPDDTEWYCGGSLAKLKDEGAEIYVLLTTDGSKGSSDPKMTRARIAATRKKEHAAANKTLGVKKAFYLDLEDGSLESVLAIRGKIVEVIRRVSPDIVFSFDTNTPEHNHPDHRVTAQAVMDAVYPSARDHLYYPEQVKKGLKPHKVKEVFLFMAAEPTVFVDIGKSIERKIEALAKHKSQYPDKKEIDNKIHMQAHRAGIKHGIEFAEEFRHLRMPL